MQRIVLEALGVTLSKDARARSLQLPAWNEALGLPRPWDQQWALRIQQVLAFETDLLEYDDIFDGSHVIEAKTAELVDGAQAELDEVLALGGAFEAIDELKGRLVAQPRRADAPDRVRRAHRSSASTPSPRPPPSPLGGDDNILQGRPRRAGGGHRRRWPSGGRNRDNDAVKRSARRAAPGGRAPARTSCRPPSTWPTPAAPPASGPACCARCSASTGPPPAWPPRPGAGGGSDGLRAVAERVKAMAGGPPRFLVAKPGLDGHSNGAEQIAVAARDAGMEVIYQGIRLTPEQIAAVGPRRGRRRDRPLDPVGQPPRAGARGRPPAREAEGVDAPVIVGGIIPEDDRPRLLAAGVAAVYTPKDFELAKIMGEIADLVEQHRAGLTVRGSEVTAMSEFTLRGELPTEHAGNL